MQSNWTKEILAIFRKELTSEIRSLSDSYSALILGVATVFSLAFSSYGKVLDPHVAAGLLWTGLISTGIGGLSRGVLREEELGTGDLLRLWARPHAVFWGKALFNCAMMLLTAVLLSTLFLFLTEVTVTRPLIFAGSLLGGAVALAGVVTFCSALIARGSNRATLAGVVSIPILLPLIALGVGAGRASLGETIGNGAVSLMGTWAYAIAVFALAPHIFAFVWEQK
jgi:heme exporter protein B